MRVWVVIGVTIVLGASCLRSLPDIPANPNGVTVSGRVVEREAASGVLVPVAGVRVVTSDARSTTSDPEGRFEIPSLPLGPIRLAVWRPVPGRDPRLVKVVSGLSGRADGERVAVGDVDVRDPGTLHGTVTLAGQPDPSLAEGTLVAVAETAFRAIVDQRGRYMLARIPEGGTYDVVAFRAGYAPGRVGGVSVLANASIELLALALEPLGAESRREVPGVARLAERASEGTGHGGIAVACLSETSTASPAVTGTTDDAGNYLLTLAYGLYRCDFTREGSQAVRLAGVAVLVEGVLGLPAVVLGPLGDIDGDGQPDASDADRDGDGAPDDADRAPDDPTAVVDSDGDGVVDAIDLDDDDDDVSDAEESSLGRDDAITDRLRSDTDDDDVPDGRDVCPAVADPAQTDTDGDGRGDACPADEAELPGPGQLALTGFSPARAGVGVAVTLRGAGFDRIARNNVVTFAGDVLAQATATTLDRLTVLVPAGAQSGPLTVYNGRSTMTSTGSLTIVPPPVVTAFAPVAASIGQTVIIHGRGLERARVWVGATEAAVLATTPERLDVVVPPVTAGSYALEVRGEGGVARPGLPLVVLGEARIIALVPQVAGRGQQLRILGAGFLGQPDDAVEVVFAGAAMPAMPTQVRADELRVVIPDDAMSGTVTVRVGPVAVVSGTPLTIDGNLATIRGIDAVVAFEGETVRISGDNLQRVTTVRVGGAVVPHTVVSPTLIEMTVPVGLRAGAVTVEARDAGNRVVTSTAPAGLSLLREVGRRRAGFVSGMAFDPTREVLYAAIGNGVRGVTVNLPSMVVTGTVPINPAANQLVISPDGRFVVEYGRGGPPIFALPSWTRFTCGMGNNPTATAFSPDSRSVFSANFDGIVHVDLTTPVPSCRQISGLRSAGMLHTDSSRQLLAAQPNSPLVVIDADPSSPQFGSVTRTGMTSVRDPPRLWSPPTSGRPSGEIGAPVWSTSGVFQETIPFSSAPPQAIPETGVAELVHSTQDRRWAVARGSNNTIVVVDLAERRARTISAVSAAVVAAGGPVPRIAYATTSEVVVWDLDAAPLE